MPGFSPKADGYQEAYLTVGSLRCSDSKGKSLAVNGHIDVVPEGPHDMWSTRPFDPVIKNGWMHGRGAGDMKSGWVCGLFALKALKRADYRPAADVSVEAEGRSTGGREAGIAAVRDACHERVIARDVLAHFEAEGGLMTAQDLADCKSGHEPPETVRFGDWELFSCGA